VAERPETREKREAWRCLARERKKEKRGGRGKREGKVCSTASPRRKESMGGGDTEDRHREKRKGTERKFLILWRKRERKGGNSSLAAPRGKRRGLSSIRIVCELKVRIRKRGKRGKEFR